MSPSDTLPELFASRYADDPPFLFRFACAWMKYAPKAKGWLPRVLGRRFGRCMTCAVRTRAGARLAADPLNLDFYCLIKLRDGVWEEDVIDACLRLVRPGDVFFDIGANAGVVTLDVAKTFGDAVTIHSFEPQPSVAHSLELSIALSEVRNVTLHQMLLGEQPGEVDFFIADHSIHSSLISREAGATRIACRMDTLDALVDSSQLPAPTAVKLDVEGAELQVLRGARKTFTRQPPAIIFEADENMPRFGYSHRELFGLLSEFAPYAFYRIDGREWTPIGDPSAATMGNYVALPPARPLPPAVRA